MLPLDGFESGGSDDFSSSSSDGEGDSSDDDELENIRGVRVGEQFQVDSISIPTAQALGSSHAGRQDERLHIELHNHE